MSHRLTVPAQQIVKEFLRAADEVRETGAANFGPDGLAEEQIVDHVVGRRLPEARVVLPADAVGAADHMSPLVEVLGEAVKRLPDDLRARHPEAFGGRIYFNRLRAQLGARVLGGR